MRQREGEDLIAWSCRQMRQRVRFSEIQPRSQADTGDALPEVGRGTHYGSATRRCCTRWSNLGGVCGLWSCSGAVVERRVRVKVVVESWIGSVVAGR